MSEREQYPAGVPCWVDTAQPDPDAAIRFYQGLFGWEFIGPGPMPGEPAGKYFVAQARGRDVAGVSSMPPEGAPPMPVWNTYVSVQSADETADRVSRAGGSIAASLFDVLPAGRMAVVRDPAGAYFCAWEPGTRQGAQLVNEPGAWATSMLHTRDISGSLQFYATVFGWETEPIDFGGTEVTLWRLPGYVGGEPLQPVPRDVVGVMLPLSDEPPEHAAPRPMRPARPTAAHLETARAGNSPASRVAPAARARAAEAGRSPARP